MSSSAFTMAIMLPPNALRLLQGQTIGNPAHRRKRKHDESVGSARNAALGFASPQLAPTRSPPAMSGVVALTTPRGCSPPSISGPATNSLGSCYPKVGSSSKPNPAICQGFCGASPEVARTARAAAVTCSFSPTNYWLVPLQHRQAGASRAVNINAVRTDTRGRRRT
jgi:hypothetical protein